MNETGIRPQVLQEIRGLAQKHHINRVLLFGSRARGDNTLKSDYDIAVFAHNMDISEQAHFLEEIDNIKTIVHFFEDSAIDVIGNIEIFLNDQKIGEVLIYSKLKRKDQFSFLTWLKELFS